MATEIASRPQHRVDHILLTERHWVEERFTDKTYGAIADAMPDEDADTYGYLADDGTISWDERIPS